MAELTPDVSDPRPAGNGAAPSSSGEPDPFLTLYKMSTTAGVGSADYVAINGTAIAAVLLGIASALVLFQSLLLLIVPIIGIVCAFLAFKQIKNSNGTQTGGGLALVGLLLSLGLGGYCVGKQGYETVRNRKDESKVTALINQFGTDISREEYDQAYALFDDRFTGRVPPAVFTAKWDRLNHSPLFGRLKAMESNHLLKFANDPVTDDRICSGMTLLSFDKIPGQDRVAMVFRELDGKWWLDDVPDIFPQVTPAKGSGPAPAAPSGPAGPPAPR